MKNTRWLKIVLGIVLFSFAFSVFADDAAPAVSAPVSGETILPQWLATAITVGEGIIALLIGLFFAFLKRRMSQDKDKQDALEALRVGVTSTYHGLYGELKKDSDDGKLTAEEKRQLRENAISEAKKVATGPALTILKSYGSEILHSLVERIVAQMKGKKEA